MAIILLPRGGTGYSCRLTVRILLSILILCSGCKSGVYQVSNLPAECLAPSPVNPGTVNLAGLTETTVGSGVIQPGDVLEVTMVTDYEKMTPTTTPVRVANDGAITVPLVGKVGVAGMEVQQAEEAIAAESVSRGIYRNPYITLTMKQCRTNKITVVGAVDKPGTVELPMASCSLLNALVAAGGLSKDADSEVEIRRTDVRNLPAGRQQGGTMPAAEGTGNILLPAGYQQEQPPAAPLAAMKINLNAIGQGAEKPPDLHDGDVVYVAKRTPKPVYVMGLVRKPGEFPYPMNQEIRVLDAIALAGGCSNPWAENVLIIRRSAGKTEPIRIAVSLQSAKQGQDNVALAPGDTVSVEQTPVTAVLDFVQTFIRVGVGASMSLF
jgi:polysaccharide export outer membrane protein